MSQSAGRDEEPHRFRTRTSKKRDLRGKSTVGGVALVILAGIYSLAAPSLNARFGWNLPEIGSDSRGEIRFDDSSQASGKPSNTDTKSASATTLAEGQAKTDSQRTNNSSSAETQPTKQAANASESKSNAGPLAGRVRTSSGKANDPARGPPTTTAATGDKSIVTAEADDLLYGILREVSRDRYISPAGLQYTPGSAEGHRLEHLRRHTKDDPGRPGKHGVFDGNMEGALKTIDAAYGRAKQGQRTTKQVDDGRTIYTVDMGRRVGFVGGREGGRKRNPMARRVRLVLEGTRVITAYPL